MRRSLIRFFVIMAAKKRSEDFSSETMAAKYIDVYKVLEC